MFFLQLQGAGRVESEKRAKWKQLMTSRRHFFDTNIFSIFSFFLREVDEIFNFLFFVEVRLSLHLAQQELTHFLVTSVFTQSFCEIKLIV